MVLFPALIYLTIVLSLLHFEVFDFSLTDNGLPAWVIVAGILLMLLGSLIDVPLILRGPGRKQDRRHWHSLFLVTNGKKARKGLYLNLGGAIVPILLAIYLFSHAPLVPTLIALAVVTIITRFMTRISSLKGNWLHLSALVPLLAALCTSLLLTPANPAIVFYLAGTLGTLVGAGLLNINKINEAPLFIGGRGMFHGIFLVNVVFLLL
ncbi:DUF1614 domain-containing protein [Patescibacteria group bacterium]|nr:DUF1614 domain-containing protein [Patescibacteria group bacterium]